MTKQRQTNDITNWPLNSFLINYEIRNQKPYFKHQSNVNPNHQITTNEMPARQLNIKNWSKHRPLDELRAHQLTLKNATEKQW